ncbi:MAG: CvpA family protein [Candidatus Cardinium sp.]|nr:CvpA family protein [Candidatus Cardinium sp.]
MDLTHQDPKKILINIITMNRLDILLTIPLVVGMYSGFRKGFVVELVSCLLLLVGLRQGVSLFHGLLPIALRTFPALAEVLPTCLTILLLMLGGGVVYVLIALVRRMVHYTFLGTFDNLLGALLGFCKSAFCMGMLLYGWSYIDFKPLPPVYMANSKLVPLLQSMIPCMVQFFKAKLPF